MSEDLHDRIEELRARNHDLANEVMQERAKRMQAEEDKRAFQGALDLAALALERTGALIEDLRIGAEQQSQSHVDVLTKIAAFRTQHKYGEQLVTAQRASLLAVAQAAAAFVEAGEYDDLASLLVALKEAVKEWRR